MEGIADEADQMDNKEPFVKNYSHDAFSINDGDSVGPDIILYVSGRPIGAHRAVLAARCPYFKKKFVTEWKDRHEVRLANPKLTYPALFSLVHFFYTDRLDIAVDDMEDLVRICKFCGCSELQKALEKELVHQKYADYKSIKGIDDSQKRFILQGSCLPESERLSGALRDLFMLSLGNSENQRITDTLGCENEGNPSETITKLEDAAKDAQVRKLS